MNIHAGGSSVDLGHANLGNLPSQFVVPSYDPAQVTAGILHIGPSAFFRSHLAYFAHQLLNKAQEQGKPLRWGIRAVSLRSTDVRDALAPQDYLYTLTSKGTGGHKHEIVGSLKDILCSREDTNEVLEAAADPAIRMLTLTVTQKGYYTNGSGLDFNHEDIKACLDQNNPELSTIGLIVHSLKLRKERGIRPPVVLSCDNLTGNGTILKNAVMAYANHIDKELGEWIGAEVPFPNSMVDRITPGRSAEHVMAIGALGVRDAWPVEAEHMPKTPFVVQKMATNLKQFHFSASGIDDFSVIGAIFDGEIAAYENMKVRTLNGVHMALGCVGYLSGFEHSHEAMADYDVRAFAKGFMEEVGHVLKPVQGVDVAAFRNNVAERLDNADICDPLTRLARNGVDKLGTRFLDSIRDCVAKDQSYGHLSFALASWLHYTSSLDEHGYLPSQKNRVEFQRANNQKLDDPNDAKSAKIGLPEAVRNSAYVGSVFAMTDVFGEDFSQRSDVIQSVQTHFDNIRQHGMKEALAKFVQKEIGFIPRLAANNGPKLG